MGKVRVLESAAGSEWGTREAEDLYRSAIRTGFDSKKLLHEVNLIAGTNRVTEDMVGTAMKNIQRREWLARAALPPHPRTPMVGWPTLETLAEWLKDKTGTPRYHSPERTPHVTLLVRCPGGGSVGCLRCEAISVFPLLDAIPHRNAPEYPAAILALLEAFEAKHRECVRTRLMLAD